MTSESLECWTLIRTGAWIGPRLPTENDLEVVRRDRLRDAEARIAELEESLAGADSRWVETEEERRAATAELAGLKPLLSEILLAPSIAATADWRDRVSEALSSQVVRAQ